MTSTNILIASSNLIVVPLIYQSRTAGSYWLLMPAIVSFLYHLAETRHRLPGIYPINRYESFLIKLDRLFAFGSALYIIYHLLYNPSEIMLSSRKSLLFRGLFGLLLLEISERDILYLFLYRSLKSLARGISTEISKVKDHPLPPQYKVGQLDFLVSHIGWHMIAFSVLAEVIESANQ
jgi:hypothetical protein